MASHAIAWLTRRQMSGAHRDDQGALRRLHDHHAQPHRRGRRATQSDLTARAVRLLEKTDAGRRPVRLLGVSVHNFCGEAEPATRTPIGCPSGHRGHKGNKGHKGLGPDPCDLVHLVLEVLDDPGIRRSTTSSSVSASSRSTTCSPWSGRRRHARRGPGMRHRQADTRQLHARLAARETIGIDRSARMLAEQPSGPPHAGPQVRGRDHRIVSCRRRALRSDVFERRAPLGRRSRAADRTIGGKAGARRVSSPSRCRRMHDEASHLVADELSGEEPFASALGGWRRRSRC